MYMGMNTHSTPHFAFDNSYARLPERLFARVMPDPAPAPQLVAWNSALAEALDLPALDRSQKASIFSGTEVPDSADPLAMAYAGHQFGGFVPQLGDGRAHLLGEVIGRDGRRWDIQLKGSGRTPFSRGGDGRAALGPVLREYLVSEAMAALGVPTTRALAVVTTGAAVLREAGPLPGAVLTRVAQSHLRVGTFQFFAVRQDIDALHALADHAIARHFPDTRSPQDLLRATVDAQARLVAHWMSLGFVHGVMNTDNCHVGGLTIDYGPCAFLDEYYPHKVFSSIDSFGRYAYSNQPHLAVWNLAQFATCLLPLFASDQDAAVEEATAIVHGFSPLYQQAWLDRFRAKLGLMTARDGDEQLIMTLLDRMALLHADFTRVFHALGTDAVRSEFAEPEAFDAWYRDWVARLGAEGSSVEAARARMTRVNPALIPRNHQIEAAIGNAQRGDLALFHRLSQALVRPFDVAPEDVDLQAAPLPDERVRATFCGT